MKKTDALVQLLLPSIRDRAVLEVACGSADFSIAAAPFAGSVSCIDLEASRLNPQIRETGPLSDHGRRPHDLSGPLL